MINPTAWNWGNYVGFLWGGTCFLMVIYHYFRLPEPSGQSFEEMGIYFERRTPATKFKVTNVNAFDVALTSQGADDKPEVYHCNNAGGV